MPSAFFDQPQGAAVLKHGILSRYLPPFIFKAGRWAPGRRVVYLDGYAGPGMYEDESPGSPELAIKAAVKAAEHREVECLFVERDRHYYDQLRDRLVQSGHSNWEVWHGRLEELLGELLKRAAGAPMFALLDPFGMGLSYQQLTSQLLARAGGPGGRIITEVLLNFSTTAVVRAAGLRKERPSTEKRRKTRESTLQRLSDTLGGDWWETIYDTYPPGRRLDEVLRSYMHQFRGVGAGWTTWSVPVADKWGARPDYHLVFLTQHPDGVWHFGEAVSGAMEAYYNHFLGASPQQQMDLDSERAERWIIQLTANLEALVAQGKPFVIHDRYAEIFDGVLGRAREKHLRAALNQLQDAGRLVCNTKGSLRKRIVRPAQSERPGQTGTSVGY